MLDMGWAAGNALAGARREDSRVEAAHLAGRVERVVFHNPANGYCVLKVRNEEDCFGGSATAVGYLPQPREGYEYRFEGAWVDHPKFGRQFQFDSADIVPPTSREGLIAYLSDVAYGVGPVRAEKIVDALGEDCLQKIQDDPACLDALDFLTPKQRDEIRQHLAQNRALAELTALICRHGITPRLAAKIYKQYGADSVKMVKENPYILADEVWGIGFLTADRIARAVGIAPDSPHRVQAAVEYVVKEAQSEGHCYLRPRDIVPRVQDLLGAGCGVGVPEIKEACERLIEAGRLVREDYAVYAADLYGAERRVAACVRRLVGTPLKVPDALDGILDRIESSLSIKYDRSQREAVRTALCNRLSVVTGGPGTGKTTVTRSVVEAYSVLYPKYPVYLASPTGRAAKRLSEVVGREAKTIHRLLEYHPEVGFRRDETNPLEAGLLVVDEVSMVDLALADSLLRAVPQGMQVVLVGDADQLPSVGPGSVLRDLIASGIVPVTRLQFVYRQAAGSEIHLWAHLVREGTVPHLVSGDDVTVVECREQEDALAAAVEYARAAHAEVGLANFQVLAPMKKGVAGVAALNEAVREAVNPAGANFGGVKLGGTTYRLGDKAIVVANDYELEVFNGDIGLVAGLKRPTEDGGPSVTVDIVGRGQVEFAEDRAKLLTLAYASTVHKCQGGEFDTAIVVLTRGHYVMLQRNLLYTAVTRAKRRLVVIHQPGSIERAVANDRIAERYSRLTERLRAQG